MAAPPPTERLTFREMSVGDLDFMVDLLGDPAVMAYYPRPKSRAEILDWIDWNARLYRERGYGLWLLSLRDTGRLVGECGITPQDVEGVEEVELGYHMQPGFQRRGLATEAALAVRDHAREAFAIQRLIAIIDPRNVPSQRVAQKAGLGLERALTRAGRPVEIYATGGRAAG
jgi:RimJ/RimL family protein N-acetyltransferase